MRNKWYCFSQEHWFTALLLSNTIRHGKGRCYTWHHDGRYIMWLYAMQHVTMWCDALQPMTNVYHCQSTKIIFSLTPKPKFYHRKLVTYSQLLKYLFIHQKLYCIFLRSLLSRQRLEMITMSIRIRGQVSYHKAMYYGKSKDSSL